MWNIGPNDTNFRNHSNGYDVTPPELSNHTERAFSSSNAPMTNQAMFLPHVHHPERGNARWTHYPSVENRSHPPISQNSMPSLANFTRPRSSLPYPFESTGPLERIWPDFGAHQSLASYSNPKVDSGPLVRTQPDFTYGVNQSLASNSNPKFDTGPVERARPNFTYGVNQSLASYTDPKVDTKPLERIRPDFGPYGANQGLASYSDPKGDAGLFERIQPDFGHHVANQGLASFSNPKVDARPNERIQPDFSPYGATQGFASFSNPKVDVRPHERIQPDFSPHVANQGLASYSNPKVDATPNERIQPDFGPHVANQGLTYSNSKVDTRPLERTQSDFTYGVNQGLTYSNPKVDAGPHERIQPDFSPHGANQSLASYSNPNVETNPNSSGVSEASEVSSETYKKACDALLAYAQMKRNANEKVTLNGNGNRSESTKGEAGLEERENALTKRAQSFEDALWDGILQLNTVTEVSAVALFKSGERVVDASWQKFVDVKGKVRLEALEKFLQELPRSRNRALTVISIHWKPGTPDSGFKGMKEVAKGYKDQQKVGYAQFSPGVDLYVCPRSDAVITILAKYGFLRGMGVVEEDQDSLIGCVVWRRSRPVSEPATGPVDPPDLSPLPLNSDPSLSTAAPDLSLSSLLPQLQPLTSQIDLHQVLSSAVMLLMQDNAKLSSPVNVDRGTESQPNEEDLPEFDFGAATRGPPRSQVSSLEQTSGLGPMSHLSSLEPEKLRPMNDGNDRVDRNDDDDDDDDDMPEWCPPRMAMPQRQLPSLLPSPPLPPPPPLLFEKNQDGSKQDQRGILGQRPVDLYPKIPPFLPRLEAQRSGSSGPRSSPEVSPRSRSKKQKRSSGWDIGPPDEESGWSQWH